MLEAAGLEHARLLVITTPAVIITRSVAEAARSLHAELHIVARVESLEQVERLHELDVYEIVQPELEAGLEMTRQALLHLSIPNGEIQNFLDAVRRKYYAPIYHLHDDYDTLSRLRHAGTLLDLTWVTIHDLSPLVGQTLRECDIRQRTGASVVAIMSNQALQTNPSPHYRFRAGDIVGVIADPQQVEEFNQLVAEPV